MIKGENQRRLFLRRYTSVEPLRRASAGHSPMKQSF